jgi:leucyl/phenylalanyl-tRNA--protein transferase
MPEWDFPDAREFGPDDLVAVGGDLEPQTLLDAYARGLFPMRVRRMLGWWSPDPRGIMPLDGFRLSRSLRRSIPRFEVRVNTAFVEVMRACADPKRPNGWIDGAFITAYANVHRLGHAHSVEAWRDGELVGGVYGIRIGDFFAGESMFHRETDASKVALWATVELLRMDGVTLFDVQWTNPHLVSLGAVDVSREEFLRLLACAL